MTDSRTIIKPLVCLLAVLMLAAAGSTARAFDPEDPLLILVSTEHPLPDDYLPMDLVDMDTYCDTNIMRLQSEGMEASQEALDALHSMFNAAASEGVRGWQISQAYRSHEDQEAIWNKTYNDYRKNENLSKTKAAQATDRRVARPGCSEHHTGLAFDITIKGQSFRLTEQCKWLAKHCAEYGFIIRYTEAKEPITGITSEPWHIRYVGLEAAKEMTDQGLCLEEYLGL